MPTTSCLDAAHMRGPRRRFVDDNAEVRATKDAGPARPSTRADPPHRRGECTAGRSSRTHQSTPLFERQLDVVDFTEFGCRTVRVFPRPFASSTLRAQRAERAGRLVKPCRERRLRQPLASSTTSTTAATACAHTSACSTESLKGNPADTEQSVPHNCPCSTHLSRSRHTTRRSHAPVSRPRRCTRTPSTRYPVRTAYPTAGPVVAQRTTVSHWPGRPLDDVAQRSLGEGGGTRPPRPGAQPSAKGARAVEPPVAAC
jgi:hypothetical protein